MKKISAIYKITNTITGDCYIGSSKDIKRRWAEHKKLSVWNRQPNNPMYQDMKKYGVDKFELEILAEVEPDKLKEMEQQFIEELKPAYNSNRAKGWDTERFKKTMKEYEKTDKRKESHRKYQKEYNSQLCSYNGQALTLNALRLRFQKAGIPHPTAEAKKYLLEK